MLNRMTELGMERLERRCADDREEADARRAVGQVTGMILTPQARASRDAGELMFQQTTRALRLCMALADKFHTARLERARQEAAERAAGEKQRKSRLKDQLARLVKEAIEQDGAAEAEGDDGDDPGHEPESGDDAETGARDETDLTQRVTERLTEYDIERDIGERPFSELVGRICREMGIEPPWELWQDDHWAQEEARLGTPGSPYAQPPVPEPAAAPAAPAGIDAAAGRPEPPSG